MRRPVPAQRGHRSMSGDLGPDAVDAYLRHAFQGDGPMAVRLALDLIDDGVPSQDVIVDLLAAAQREAGNHWLADRWTVADEHLVSGVSQKALDAVAHTIEPPTGTGLTVVACAEGDWHSLPAQMLAEMLRGHGFRVAFLGASTPAAHVGAFLARQRAEALAVSCNLAVFFSGVTRLADAAHSLGIPVLAGGPALGRDPRRAIRLGADAWAAGVDEAVTVLRGWQQERPRVAAAPTAFTQAAAQLDLSAGEIADRALTALVAGNRPIAAFSQDQLGRARDDLADITRYTAAARLADDPAVLTGMLGWLRTYLVNRRVPAVVLSAGLSALAPLVRPVDPEAARLLLDAAADEPAFLRPGESG